MDVAKRAGGLGGGNTDGNNLPVAAVMTASVTTRWNSSTGLITWSAAKEPMMASGSRRWMIAQARPIAAAESLGEGSSTRSAARSSGICCVTALACGSAGNYHDGTVAEIGETVVGVTQQELPDEVRSSRNFGACARDRGHKREPTPPAGMSGRNRVSAVFIDSRITCEFVIYRILLRFGRKCQGTLSVVMFEVRIR